MTHTEILDRILSDSCAREVYTNDEGAEVCVFEYDLCCQVVRVHATLASVIPTITYKIVKVENA